MFSAHCVLIIQSHLEATVIFKFSLSFPSDYLLLFLFFLKQILSLYLRQALNPWSLSISQPSKFLDWRCTSTHWAFPIWLSSHIFPFPSQNISSLISVHFCPKLKGFEHLYLSRGCTDLLLFTAANPSFLTLSLQHESQLFHCYWQWLRTRGMGVIKEHMMCLFASWVTAVEYMQSKAWYIK